jgi:hypothetical protein
VKCKTFVSWPARSSVRGAASRSHGEWGDGVVQRYDGGQVAILFEEVGYKTLSVELVVERDLLETVS